MSTAIRDSQAMLSGMTPDLGDEVFVFCSVEPEMAHTLYGLAAGTFIEDEGTTLVLRIERAEALGFDTGMPMRRITLKVCSALDGVGLTAVVATALATENIPCNVIAAFHHDHIFVPAHMAQEALFVLQNVQRRAQANG